MVVLADVTVGPEAFPLGTLLESHAAVRVEFGRAVPTDVSPLEFIWFSGIDTDTLTESVPGLPAIEDLELHGSIAGRFLVRVRYADDVLPEFVWLLLESPIVLHRAIGVDGKWHLRLVATDNVTLRTFYEDCRTTDVGVEIDQLHTDLEACGTAGMTEKQSVAVAAAVEAGFFEVPRRTSLAELAEQFDISEQALSKRIRRGVHTVLNDHLHHTPE